MIQEGGPRVGDNPDITTMTDQVAALWHFLDQFTLSPLKNTHPTEDSARVCTTSSSSSSSTSLTSVLEQAVSQMVDKENVVDEEKDARPPSRDPAQLPERGTRATAVQEEWAALRLERERTRQYTQQALQAVARWRAEQEALGQLQHGLYEQQQQQQQMQFYQQDLVRHQEINQRLVKDLQLSWQHFQQVEQDLHLIIREQQQRIERLEQSIPNSRAETSMEAPLPTRKTLEPISTLEEEKQTLDLPAKSTPAPIITPRADDEHARRSSRPRSTSGGASSTATHSSKGRTRKRTDRGGEIISYGNGATKEIFPDGNVVIRFSNGDVETRGVDGSRAYYFHASGVLQVTHLEQGCIDYQFPHGQIERHWPDHSKTVTYPDGTVQRFPPHDTTDPAASEIDRQQQYRHDSPPTTHRIPPSVVVETACPNPTWTII